MIKIDKFIENFKKGFDEEELKNVFTNGNCYHFALILEGMFHNGEIVYDSHMQHFAFLHKGRFYDITGEIKAPLDYQLWEDMIEEDSEEFHEVVRDCVYKI